MARHAECSQNLEFTRKIILEMTQPINDLTIEITPRGPLPLSTFPPLSSPPPPLPTLPISPSSHIARPLSLSLVLVLAVCRHLYIWGSKSTSMALDLLSFQIWKGTRERSSDLRTKFPNTTLKCNSASGHFFEEHDDDPPTLSHIPTLLSQ